MARITRKMMNNDYCVEPLFWASADFVISIYSWDRLNYIGRSV